MDLLQLLELHLISEQKLSFVLDRFPELLYKRKPFEGGLVADVDPINGAIFQSEPKLKCINWIKASPTLLHQTEHST